MSRPVKFEEVGQPVKFEENGHKYFVDGVRVPNVTSILKVGGFTDFFHVDPDVLKRSMDFGTAVHKATYFYDLFFGKGLDMAAFDPEIMPYLNAWIKFRKDSGISFDRSEIEVPLYSESLRIAGTPDRYKKASGDIWDIKSGGIYSASGLQLAGYSMLIEHNFGIKIKHRYIVQLKAEKYKIEECKEVTDRIVFCGAVSGYFWKLKNGLIKKGE